MFQVGSHVIIAFTALQMWLFTQLHILLANMAVPSHRLVKELSSRTFLVECVVHPGIHSQSSPKTRPKVVQNLLKVAYPHLIWLDDGAPCSSSIDLVDLSILIRSPMGVIQ